MKEHRVYTIVFLILTGGLVLDLIPSSVIHGIDTLIGRVFAFLGVVLLGGLLGVPEAILAGTVVGLLIDRSHDDAAMGLVAGSGSGSGSRPMKGVLRDMTPSYTGNVAQRLGLVTLDSHRNIMENTVSYNLQ